MINSSYTVLQGVKLNAYCNHFSSRKFTDTERARTARHAIGQSRYPREYPVTRSQDD